MLDIVSAIDAVFNLGRCLSLTPELASPKELTKNLLVVSSVYKKSTFCNC